MIPGRDQRPIPCTTESGSSSYEALQLLEVIGTQDLSALSHQPAHVRI